MPITLILNQSNLTGDGGNSNFLYKFPQGGFSFKDQFIAVQQISLYNSAFNITITNNNNSFSYIWVDGSVNSFTLPNGYYELPEINAFLQSNMYDNGHYLLTSTNQIVYLLEIVINASRYAFQINSYIINTTIATTNSWTVPTGTTWIPTVNAICPIFVVPNTNFQQLIGYNAGNYPNAVITGTTQATYLQTPTYLNTQSFLSAFAPQIVPQPFYLCTCSLVNNRLAIPSQLIYSLSPQGSAFGSLYTVQMSELAFNKIEDGHYTQFLFRFVDNNGLTVYLQDPNTNILLVIKSKTEMAIT